MKTRVLSGLILAPLLVIVYFGGWPLLIGSFIICTVSIHEFFSGFKKLEIRPSSGIAYAGVLLLYMTAAIGAGPGYYMAWLFFVVFMSMLYLFKIAERSLNDAMATIIGLVYVAFFSVHVVLIDHVKGYEHLIWLVFLAAFGTDTMAYFSGFLFGKHKLCPDISPKKTVEGAIGGTIGSILLCSLFGYFLAPDLFFHCMAIGFIGSVVAQFGDLTASIFKRKMGIKDYGNLIPGHGGMLDRFDSIIFTAPFVYYYITLVIL